MEQFTEVVTTLSENNEIDYTWIGVDDISNNGQWVYSSSGEAVNFTPWASGLPSTQDNHDCVHLGDIDNIDKWFNSPCSTNCRFICEF